MRALGALLCKDSATAGAQGTPVDVSSYADFCDAAEALVYTEQALAGTGG